MALHTLRLGEGGCERHIACAAKPAALLVSRRSSVAFLLIHLAVLLLGHSAAALLPLPPQRTRPIIAGGAGGAWRLPPPLLPALPLRSALLSSLCVELARRWDGGGASSRHLVAPKPPLERAPPQKRAAAVEGRRIKSQTRQAAVSTICGRKAASHVAQMRV